MAIQDPTAEQFAILRKRAKQAAETSTQQEKEGLARRFAALGQVGSGAQIRAESQAAERGAERLAKAEETVGIAELAERQRQKDIAEQRAFASSERQAGQKFAAEQAALGRQYTTQERLSGQDFASGQAKLGREFASGEAKLGREFASGEALKGREYATGERLSSQDFASQQAQAARLFQKGESDLTRAFQERAYAEDIRRYDQEFIRDSDTLAFNRKMAEDAANSNFLTDLGFNPNMNFGDIGAGAGVTGNQVFRALGINTPSFGGLF